MKKTIAFITAATVLATGGLAVSAAPRIEPNHTRAGGARYVSSQNHEAQFDGETHNRGEARPNYHHQNQLRAGVNHRNYNRNARYGYRNHDGQRELLGHPVRYGQDGRAISNYHRDGALRDGRIRDGNRVRNHGEGIGNERTLGRMTFIMVDRDNPDTVLETFTTEVQTGRYRALRDKNVPGWRIDRQGFRNAIRANRGAQTITVPMIRDDTARNTDFGIQGREHGNHYNPAYGVGYGAHTRNHYNHHGRHGAGFHHGIGTRHNVGTHNNARLNNALGQ